MRTTTGRVPVPRRIVLLNSTTPRTAAEQRVLDRKVERSYGPLLDAGWEIEVWGVGPRFPATNPLLLTAAMNALHFALVLRRPRAGILVGVGGWTTLGAALALRVTGRRSPLVVKVNVHSAGDTMRRRGRRVVPRLLLQIERLALRTADLVVAVGASTKRFAEQLGVPPSRIVQLSAVVAGQTTETTRVTSASSSTRDPYLIVCAARLEPRKAVDVLVQAMAEVHASHPDARLEIAGDGRERATLEALVAEHGLDGAVTFRGGLKRRDMPTFYERAAIFVLPSRGDEGLPKVVVEAGLAGCALVGTDVRGTAELITPGVSGELVAPDDPGALAAAIVGLLSDPARARALAERGQDVARAHQADAAGSQREVVERMLALQGEGGMQAATPR